MIRILFDFHFSGKALQGKLGGFLRPRAALGAMPWNEGTPL